MVRFQFLQFYIIKRKIIISGDAFTTFHGLTDCGNRRTQMLCNVTDAVYSFAPKIMQDPGNNQIKFGCKAVKQIDSFSINAFT